MSKKETAGEGEPQAEPSRRDETGGVGERGVIELSSPVMVDGAERSSFPYDVGKVTVAQFSAAEEASKKAGFRVSMCECDYTFHAYLGMYAAIAADPSLDIEDLKRVSGRDINRFMAVGRFFMNASDDAEDGTSGAQ